MPKKSPSHPIQPVVVDDKGVHRFKANKIVQYMLEEGGKAGLFDLNKFAILDFDNEDHEQFAQLIGYSVSGSADLSYMSDRVYDTAKRQSQALARRGS